MKVGIRLEDKSAWEKRVPLVPADVEFLCQQHGLEVIIQPSDIRVYDDEAYRRAGAEVTADLSAAKAIFSVKEVPIPKLMPDRAYIFFAHVIKGQPYNMPLLRRLLDLNITLVDYERIVDHQGHRLVKFGLEAGQAGMIDTLSTLGNRLRVEGVDTPLASLEQAYRYPDLATAKQHIEEAGRVLAKGYAYADGPLVMGFTGRGSVSQGAQEIFDLLPHETLEPAELAQLLSSPRQQWDRVFKVTFEKHHLAKNRSGERFRESEYHQHPERFESRFDEFLPHLDVLINGIYWTEEYPRLVSRETMRQQWAKGSRRLKVIGDISCDIEGAIELTYKATQPDHPTFVYNPENDQFTDGFEGTGVVVMAVDNLPCELSLDASDQFSGTLRDFVPAIAACDYSVPFEQLELPAEILAAVVTHGGKLAPTYRYLQEDLRNAGV